MKIYTGSGDRGKTSLFSGERVSKSADRVEAFGDVDELNSLLGGLAAVLPAAHEELINEIQRIQSDLLDIGAWLATRPDSPVMADLEEITDERIQSLEQAIDRMEAGLSPLRSFLLPGGHISAAWAHVARTVCRRAERRVVHLFSLGEEAESHSRVRGVLTYLNRLSDYLFVLARHCNLLHGISDTLWDK